MVGDETEYLQPVLGVQPTQRFNPLNSSWVALLLLFLVGLIEVSGWVMIVFWPEHGLRCEPLYLLLYSHAVLWLLVMFLDHIFKWHHNKMRLDGYLTAYEQMSKYGSMPFYIVSLGNTALLVLIAGYQQMHVMLEQACTHDWTSPLIVSMAVISIEAVLHSYVLIVYLINVHRFNTAKAPPDLNNLDTWDSFTNHEVGYRERGEEMQERLQKQADSIRYYKDAVEVLQRKVMGLTAQLRGDSIN